MNQDFNWRNYLRIDYRTLCSVFTARKISFDFLRWLNRKEAIGEKDGLIAFPVHKSPSEPVIALHYKREETWRYFPVGQGAGPMLIGDFNAAKQIWVFESQWDAMAVMDRMELHNPSADLSNVAVVITRGASNAKFVEFLRGSWRAEILAFPQNDPAIEGKVAPSERWLREIVIHIDCAIEVVRCPVAFKDWNGVKYC